MVSGPCEAAPLGQLWAHATLPFHLFFLNPGARLMIISAVEEVQSERLTATFSVVAAQIACRWKSARRRGQASVQGGIPSTCRKQHLLAQMGYGSAPRKWFSCSKLQKEPLGWFCLVGLLL